MDGPWVDGFVLGAAAMGVACLLLLLIARRHWQRWVEDEVARRVAERERDDEGWGRMIAAEIAADVLAKGHPLQTIEVTISSEGT